MQVVEAAVGTAGWNVRQERVFVLVLVMVWGETVRATSRASGEEENTHEAIVYRCECSDSYVKRPT